MLRVKLNSSTTSVLLDILHGTNSLGMSIYMSELAEAVSYRRRFFKKVKICKIQPEIINMHILPHIELGGGWM